MSDGVTYEAALRVVRLLADALERYAEGDDLSLETLGEGLEHCGAGPDEIEAAVLLLRSLCGCIGSGAGQSLAAPAPAANRVPSDEERALMTPEAWGFLLALRGRKSLDPGQFEQVIDMVVGTGVRPVGVDEVREAATRVALQLDADAANEAVPVGAIELPH